MSIKRLVVDVSRRVHATKSSPLQEEVESFHSFFPSLSISSWEWRNRTEVTQSINSFAELSLKIPSLVQAIRYPPMSPRIESNVEVFSSDKYGKIRESFVYSAQQVIEYITFSRKFGSNFYRKPFFPFLVRDLTERRHGYTTSAVLWSVCRMLTEILSSMHYHRWLSGSGKIFMKKGACSYVDFFKKASPKYKQDRSRGFEAGQTRHHVARSRFIPSQTSWINFLCHRLIELPI